jgi:hypothetical protein
MATLLALEQFIIGSHVFVLFGKLVLLLSNAISAGVPSKSEEDIGSGSLAFRTRRQYEDGWLAHGKDEDESEVVPHVQIPLHVPACLWPWPWAGLLDGSKQSKCDSPSWTATYRIKRFPIYSGNLLISDVDKHIP